jgi:6-phosphogluconolactonase
MISLRRIPISGLLLLVTLIMMNLPPAQAADNNYLAYVGTYSDRGGKGIYAYRFDAKTGKLVDLGLAVATPDPSFLATSSDGKLLYAVNETTTYQGQPTGSVSSFAIHKDTGKLTPLNTLSSRGPGPAHLVIDRSGKSLLVANYDGGNVAVFPILENGSLGEASAFVQHKGSSVVPDRQKGPHAHDIAMSPDNRFALVADLGLDQIIVYPFDSAKGTLGTPHIVKVHPGAGPRHLAFSPNGKFVYLINEIQSSINSFSYSAANGELQELQTVSTLPKEFKGANDTAEIEVHPSGRFLYGSNRGQDSVVLFTIDPAKGTLTNAGFTLTRGKTPRNFAIDPTGHWLFAENHESDNFVIFKIDEKTGQLTPQGDALHVPAPVCIKFVAIP